MSEVTAHVDENQNNSIIGVQGTLGTADTKGTATTLPIGVDPTTGAAYVYNLGPAGSVTMGDITGGTIDIISGGSIVVTAGTVTTTMGDLSGGTIDILTDGTISKIGTISNIAGGSMVITAGTVETTMGDLSGGTIDILTDGTISKIGTVSNLAGGSIVVTNGTITSVGTIPGIGIVGNINTGSVVLTAGTIGQVTPGTAAAQLGKQYAQTAGSTDVGIAVMAKVLSSDSHDDNNADGQYGRLSITDFRELRVRDQRALDLANCNVPGDYTALSNDTTNIAGTSNHVFGTGALTFDKVDGADNTVYGGVSKALGTINVAEIFESGGFVGLGAYIPDISNVVNVFLRIGDDANNYNCWTWPVANLTAATWLNLRMAAASPDAARNLGTGWNTSALKYVAFGAEFNASTAALAGMIFDHVHIVGGRVTASDINAAITSSVTTPNVNLQRVGGIATSTGNGASGAGVLRVTVANDSTGKLATVGTVSNVAGGSIVVTAGTVGTVTNVATVGTVSNVAGGSIVVTAGTVASVGTIPGIGIVGNLNTGSIVVTNGTIASSGTVTGVGVVGTVTGAGTVGGMGTLAGAGVVGTVTGMGTVGGIGTVTGAGTVGGVGTITRLGTMSILVDGTLSSVGSVVGAGTISNVGSIQRIGTLGTISNLNGGSITLVGGTVTTGTIQNLVSGSIVTTAGTIGTITTQGTVGTVQTIGTILAGTLGAVGTATGVGVVGNVNNGSIVVTAGTIASSGTVTGVGVVGNLNGGTLGILTNGTVATNILPLAGVVKTTAVALGSTNGGTALPASALASRKSLVCFNTGTITAYIGDSSVTTSSGIPVGTNTYSPAIDLGTTILYGVAGAASGGTLVVLEVS